MNFYFGFGPNLLSPGLLSVASNTISQIGQINGTHPINIHRPLLLLSCSLLIDTAIPGINTAKLYSPLNVCADKESTPNIAAPIKLNIIAIIRLHNTKYRYSALRARHVNVT